MQFALCRAAGNPHAAVEFAEHSRLSWLRFGGDVFCYGPGQSVAEGARRAAAAELSFRTLARPAAHGPHVDANHLHLVVQEGTLFRRAHPEVPVLLDRGRHMLVALDPGQVSRIAQHRARFSLRSVVPNQVVFDIAQRPGTSPVTCSKIREIVNTLCRSRYADTLAELTSYPARHSLSSHFHDAARRARDRLQMMGYDAHLEEVDLADGKTLNVVADKRGTVGDAGKVTVVAAHLDSVRFCASGPDDVTALAPGIKDNGSGSAGVLEMARVLKDVQTRHGVRFILFGGQEQGLCGSRQYAQRLDGPARARIGAVVNMDMIGVVRTDAPTVLLEGSQTVSGNTIRALTSAAHTYTGLTVHTSFQYDGSDHVPFIDADVPAVLTVEGSDSGTEGAPRACDTLNHINYDYALDILRMNTAFIVREAGL
jgi:Peptidase family M28